MLLLVCLFTSVGLMIAQTPKKVTGVVISEEDDQPVVGASVLIKGTRWEQLPILMVSSLLTMYQVLLEPGKLVTLTYRFKRLL